MREQMGSGRCLMHVEEACRGGSSSTLRHLSPPRQAGECCCMTPRPKIENYWLICVEMTAVCGEDRPYLF